uniref:BED-type domain-containing protein n=1 Tax=Daphnia galeata TaxID=27404 RepID=A0A8J2RN92_9CRUS|nr:unnamed protein product [Daphnia galeata]
MYIQPQQQSYSISSRIIINHHPSHHQKQESSNRSAPQHRATTHLSHNDLESPGDGDLSNNLEIPDNPELPSTSNIGSPTKCLHYPEQFFKFFKAGIKKGNSLYHCMVGDCKVKSKILSTTDDSRGNLKKHLRKCHPSVLDEFTRLCREIDTNKSFKATPTPNKDATQLKLSFDGYPRALTQTLLDTYIVDYICDAVLPVYHTERKDFRKFINRLCPKLRVRSRAFYRNLISRAFDAKNRELMKSVCLAIRRVVGKCDYEVLAKLLESIHKEFEITAKITATVTDSGSNFVKAFRLFATNPTISTSSNDKPQQLPDVMDQATSAYSSDLSDSEFEEEDSEYSNSVQEDSGIQEEIREMEEQQIEEFLAITNILDQKIADVIYSLPPHRRCASHTLNLIATKDSRSTKASDEITKKLDGLFVIHNETRWNSFFDAVDRFREFINNKKSDLKDVFTHFNVPYFRPAEEDYIREYVKIMRPLTEALDIFAG